MSWQEDYAAELRRTMDQGKMLGLVEGLMLATNLAMKEGQTELAEKLLEIAREALNK